jgi:hypothetical protein
MKSISAISLAKGEAVVYNDLRSYNGYTVFREKKEWVAAWVEHVDFKNDPTLIRSHEFRADDLEEVLEKVKEVDQSFNRSVL